MIFTLTALVVLLGIAIGSFVNALVFRANDNEAITGRSKCRACLTPIAAKDLIPVISFFLLKRKCRKCTSVIEWQYSIVELSMGVLFGLLFARSLYGVGFPEFVMGKDWLALFIRDALMVTFLLIIFIYDLRWRVILDRFSIPAIIIALIMNVALGADVVDLLAGGIVIAGFFALQFFLSSGRWIGGGDIRMGALMGALLGLKVGLVALFLSYIFGAIGGILLILSKRGNLQSHVPFGTFLAVGTLVAMLFGENILNWYIGLL